MNIVLITQDEPFYLRNTLEYIFDNLPQGVVVTGVVCLSPSPFEKKLSTWAKARRTIFVFGIRFFVYYGLKLIKSKVLGEGVASLLQRRNLRVVTLQNSINSPESLEMIKACEPDLLVSIQRGLCHWRFRA